MTSSAHRRSGTSLVHRLREATQVSLSNCDQCGNCSMACPKVALMDIPPCRLIRLAQTGFEGFDRRVLSSEAIWSCKECEICALKCPHDVDLPRVMAFFRWEAERLGWAQAPGEASAGASIHFGGRWSKIDRSTSFG